MSALVVNRDVSGGLAGRVVVQKDCAHLNDLLLRELALLRKLAELAHVRDEQLRDVLARERVARLRLERIPERGDDVRLGR